MKSYLPITIIILFWVLFSSCEKNNNERQTILGDKIQVLGHGGMGISSQYPFNAFESLEAALNLGADGVEIDLQMTKDSVIVAFHDRDLDFQTDFTGRVIDYNWQELKKVKYTKFPFLNYSILSIQDFLTHSTLEDKLLYFDCKIVNGNMDVYEYQRIKARKLADIVNKNSIEEQVFIESASDLFISEIHKKSPKVKFIYRSGNFQKALQQVIDSNYFGLVINSDFVSKEQITEAHEKGKAVVVWGVNSREANRNAVEKNPDIIITDKLRHLVRYLD